MYERKEITMEPRNEGKTQGNERNGRKRQRGDKRTQQQGNASTREHRKEETRQRGDESLTRHLYVASRQRGIEATRQRKTRLNERIKGQRNERQDLPLGLVGRTGLTGLGLGLTGTTNSRENNTKKTLTKTLRSTANICYYTLS